MTHDDTPIETSEADARPWRGDVPATDPEPARWYCLSRIGIATLCLDEADAKRTAVCEDDMHPLNGPHRAVRMVEVASQPATAPVVPAGWREFVARVAAQKPEKPDYWSSCGQCVHNISDAEDLLAAAPAAPVVPQPAAASADAVRFDGIDDTPQMMRVRAVLASAGVVVTDGRLIADVVAASQPAAQQGETVAQLERGDGGAFKVRPDANNLLAIYALPKGTHALYVGAPPARQAVALTEEQRAALGIVLDFYADDPRVQCLHPLMAGITPA